MTDTTLAQRLRAQGTLSVCPYDRRSPDYRTAPNDKPCPVCGGEPEGPDKCTGADLRVMAEAADRIEADAFTITRLTADNKALTAENERLDKVVIAGLLQEAIKTAGEFTAAEAKLAKVEAGETAYKTMLAQAEDDFRKAEAKLAKVEAELADERLHFSNYMAVVEPKIDRLSAELAEARKREERLLAAISWIEPPFMGAETKDEEMRFRVAQCIKDASRAVASKEGDSHAE